MKGVAALHRLLCLLLLVCVACGQGVGGKDDDSFEDPSVSTILEQSPSWSKDGDFLAYVYHPQFPESAEDIDQLWVYEAATREHRYLANGRNPAWSPVENMIAYQVGGSETNIWVSDLLGNEMQVTFFGDRQGWEPSGTCIRPAWTPDGNAVGFLHLSDSLGVVGVWSILIGGEFPTDYHIPSANVLWTEDERVLLSINRDDDVVERHDLERKSNPDTVVTVSSAGAHVSGLRCVVGIPSDFTYILSRGEQALRGGYQYNAGSSSSALLQSGARDLALSEASSLLVYEAPSSERGAVVLHLLDLTTGERTFLSDRLGQ